MHSIPDSSTSTDPFVSSAKNKINSDNISTSSTTKIKASVRFNQEENKYINNNNNNNWNTNNNYKQNPQLMAGNMKHGNN